MFSRLPDSYSSSAGSCSQKWGLTPDKYILFLGRFSPEKNCHLLTQAYDQLVTSAKLVFAGGSSHTDEYADELRRHQSDHIMFLDYVSGDAFNALLTNAALFVLPSDLEGLSLALLEAMGAGVCVLTSDIPENREVVEDAGFTFRAGDVGDFARMMGLLLTEPEIRAMAGRSAKQRILQLYQWPRIARRIASVYNELIGEKPARKQPMAERRLRAPKPGSRRVA
jgi:glycosyltransferase involved in cell wall biosynthesis